MNDWILKLTGETVEAGSEVVDSQLGFHGGVEWGWIALLVAAFAGVIWISYRWLPAELSSGRKVMLVFFACGLFSAPTRRPVAAGSDIIP